MQQSRRGSTWPWVPVPDVTHATSSIGSGDPCCDSASAASRHRQTGSHIKTFDLSLSSWLERPAHIVLSGNLQNAVQLIIASRGLLSALQLQYGAEVRVQSAESREFEDEVCV